MLITLSLYDLSPDICFRTSDNKELLVLGLGGRLGNILMRTVFFLVFCILCVYSMYYMRDYIHAVLLWTELQPPYTIFIIFVCLYTLVSLPIVWGYIVVNLACGYLYGVSHGIAVTVITATLGVTISHILCKVRLREPIIN